MKRENGRPFVASTQNWPGQSKKWLDVFLPGRSRMTFDIKLSLDSVVIQAERERHTIGPQVLRDGGIRRALPDFGERQPAMLAQ